MQVVKNQTGTAFKHVNIGDSFISGFNYNIPDGLYIKTGSVKNTAIHTQFYNAVNIVTGDHDYFTPDTVVTVVDAVVTYK